MTLYLVELPRQHQMVQLTLSLYNKNLLNKVDQSFEEPDND